MFPINKENFSESVLIDALNNLDQRMTELQNSVLANATNAANVPAVSDDPTAITFTPGMLAVLNECAQFFGVTTIVANTAASREAGATDIDPLTGLPRVQAPAPVVTTSQDLGPGNGA